MGGKEAKDDSKTKVSVSGDLLDLENNASALEKRLLVWSRGENSTTASNLLRGPPTIGPTPESSVLGRIKSFLPSLDEANRKLFSDIKANGAEQFDIESVTDVDQRYIEMDLALGVADLHTSEAVAAAELASNGQVLHLGRDTASSDESSDSDEEGDYGAHDVHPLLELIRSQEITQSSPSSSPEMQEDPKEKKDLKRKKIEQL